ncbi:polyprenyl synthetase family protein, partial [Leucobacter sp. M11]|uniref:polyprenyl synthetase family protein n=1 Tax=Leucobacter sp. M11 TaxID=2993565 RepID=UPI002D810EDA
FHAAALVHDDIIDNSDTRRGEPATHRAFEAEHREGGWRGSAERFGVAGAILLGDLLQSWSDEAFQSAATRSDTAEHAARARMHFNRMRTEVAAGQYLDVLEEQMGVFAPEDEQLERSTRVLIFKSAKYSVEAPLLIGAALAGASPAQETRLAEFGLPIGVAFQLRDDLLGVFGDSELTGKPSGDDLREGKRTVLIALTRAELSHSTQRLFDEMIGDPELSDEQIVMLQRTIRDSGAVDRVEQMIAQNVALAERALEGEELAPTAVTALRTLAKRATARNA